MTKQDIKLFAWGGVAGAIVVAIGLFATGWAITGSLAEQNARKMSQTAVTDSLAKICVAQFDGASDKTEKLAAMKQVSTWERGNFVSEQGWATMPGNDSSTGQVASACARLLEATQG